MDSLNRTNNEYRATPARQPHVSAEARTVSNRSEAAAASRQVPPSNSGSLPGEAGNGTGTTAEPTIERALTASGLPLTERNRTLVKELLHHKLPIDRQTLQMFARLAAANRSASLSTLVLMYKNQIPITPSNIRQFEAYQNGSHQLLKDIQDLTKNITELLKSLLTAREGEAPAGAEGLGSPMPEGTVLPKDMGAMEAQGGPAPDGAVGQSNLGSEGLAGQNTIASNDVAGQNNLYTNAVAGQYIDGSTGQSGMVSNGTAGLSSDALTAHTLPLQGDGETPTGPHSTATSTAAADAGSGIISHAEPGRAALTGETGRTLADGSLTQGTFGSVETTGVHHSEAAQVGDLNLTADLAGGQAATEGNLQLSDLLPWLTETLAGPDMARSFEGVPSSAGIKENDFLKKLAAFLQDRSLPELSPDFLNHLERLLKNRWTLTPEDLSRKESLKELYKKLEDDLNRLDGLLKVHRETESILQSKEPVKNLQDNLQFMKALNQLFSYIQLPVRFQDREVHGEFYVFNKKNALQGKKDIVSVLLHLNMMELGAMNIHMKLQQNRIQATFAVEKPEAGSIIDEHLPELVAALSRKGYQLQARVEQQEQPKELLKELLKQDSAGLSVQTFSFDTRV